MIVGGGDADHRCSDENLEGNHVGSIKRVKLIVSELEGCLILLQR
jgi:hypothetical protein